MSQPATAIAKLVEEMTKKLNEMYEEVKKLSDESVSAESACSDLAELNKLKMELSVTYDSAVVVVAEKMRDVPEIVLVDGTKLEKKTSYDRKSWKHEELADVVARRIVQLSTDLDTGEVSATPEMVGKELLKYLQPSYWRVKALSGIGVSADEYCEISEETKTNVIVRRPKE